MSNNSKNELFFSLSGDQISICLFNSKNGILKKCSNFQFPDRFENDLNFNVTKNLLYNNIKTFEKDNRILISNGILTIQSKKLETIKVCFKSLFDKKKLDIQDIPKFLKGGINEFVNNIKKIEILHILISKYIVNGKEYFKFPNDIKSDEIIFEIDFFCLEKSFFIKVQNLFKACNIQLTQIMSSEYSKKFASKTDISDCIAAKKALEESSLSEVEIIENIDKNRGLYDKIFNLFD